MDAMTKELVLGNKVAFGTVSAARRHYDQAAEALANRCLFNDFKTGSNLLFTIYFYYYYEPFSKYLAAILKGI
jgi:hypothetical protein